MNINYPKAKVTLPIAMVVGVAAVAGDYWLSHEFLPRASAEEVLDRVYVRQESLQAIFEDKERRELMRQKYDLEDKEELGGGLTPLESRKLKRIRDELDR